MKFDPFAWDEVPVGEWFHQDTGRLVVQLSAPGALFVRQDGYEVCAGYGPAFNLRLSADAEWRVDAPKGVRAFVHGLADIVRVPEGEVYTNADLMPLAEGHSGAVKAALRLMKLEQRQMLMEMREAFAAQHAAQPAPQPVPPTPEAVTAGETEAAEVKPDASE